MMTPNTMAEVLTAVENGQPLEFLDRDDQWKDSSFDLVQLLLQLALGVNFRVKQQTDEFWVVRDKRNPRDVVLFRDQSTAERTRDRMIDSENLEIVHFVEAPRT